MRRVASLPPTERPLSTTVTSAPAADSDSAATRPARPAPTMTTFTPTADRRRPRRSVLGRAFQAFSARPRKSSSTRLNVDACSNMKPCAAPLMTTSSAVGIRSASSSLSPRGVRMSWLPASTITGTSTSPSRSTRVMSAFRIASTWLPNACPGRPSASGPSQPIAGRRRRNERGPITQRTASLLIEPIPFATASSRQDDRSSSRHGWCVPAVHANVIERVRSGYFTAMIWLIAPPMDAPTTWAVSIPA